MDIKLKVILLHVLCLMSYGFALMMDMNAVSCIGATIYLVSILVAVYVQVPSILKLTAYAQNLFMVVLISYFLLQLPSAIIIATSTLFFICIPVLIALFGLTSYYTIKYASSLF